MSEDLRKNYINKKKYQIKYTIILLVLVFIAAGTLLTAFYRDILFQNPEVAAELFNWERYILRTGVVVFLTLIAGIFFSHKIIGPVFRLKKALKNINNGNFNSHLELRPGDEFIEMAEEINILSAKLQKLSEDQKEFKDTFKNL
ncbi:MAG: HAMP domain-containing protein [Elusimicrobiota bacterium]